MKIDYKIAIINKCLELFSIFHCTFGLFTTYTWVCKKLDKVSSHEEMFLFWEPNACVKIFLDCINLVAIYVCVQHNRNYEAGPPLLNVESTKLFWILSIPLWFLTILYLSWKFVRDCYIENRIVDQLLLVSEILLFTGTMPLIMVVNKSKININNINIYRINTFVLTITLITIMNFCLMHLSDTQIKLFLQSASNVTYYKPYFAGNNSRKVIVDDSYFKSFQNYTQTLVILFCCCCVSYIITLLSVNRHELRIHRLKFTNIEEIDRARSSDTVNYSDSTNRPKLMLPSVAIIMCILFLTITFIMYITLIILTGKNSNSYLRKLGRMVSHTFPVIMDVVSIPLMFLQINAMKTWMRLGKRKRIVDKVLLYIGTAGLMIVSLAQVKLHVYNNYYETKSLTIIHCVSMFIHCMFQFITIALATERKWKLPKVMSWHSFICPTVALFSINLGSLLIIIFNCSNEIHMTSFEKKMKKRLFKELFYKGFHSIGITLMIMARLHASIFFGKMTLFNYF